jgi:hypothetical protein
MSNRYVIIDNSYATDGIGSTVSPFTWQQFLTELSGGGSNGVINSNNYYLSGTRILSTNTAIMVSALPIIGSVSLYSWFENSPAKILSNYDINFEQNLPTFQIYDLMIQAMLEPINE